MPARVRALVPIPATVSASLSRLRGGGQRKSLSLRILPAADGRCVSDGPVAALQRHGRVLRRAIEIARLSPKEVQAALGYANQGQISKWTSGRERVPIERLFYGDVPRRFRAAYLTALAEDFARDGDGIEVATRITVKGEQE